MLLKFCNDLINVISHMVKLVNVVKTLVKYINVVSHMVNIIYVIKTLVKTMNVAIYMVNNFNQV